MKEGEGVGEVAGRKVSEGVDPRGRGEGEGEVNRLARGVAGWYLLTGGLA